MVMQAGFVAEMIFFFKKNTLYTYKDLFILA